MDTATVPTEFEKLSIGLNREINASDATQHNQPHEETIGLTKLTCGNKEFLFSRELVVKVTGGEEGWIFKSEAPEIVGFGLQRQDAHLAFRQDFATCWDVIACKDDDQLTLDAIDLKTSLKSLVTGSRIVE